MRTKSPRKKAAFFAALAAALTLLTHAPAAPTAAAADASCEEACVVQYYDCLDSGATTAKRCWNVLIKCKNGCNR